MNPPASSRTPIAALTLSAAALVGLVLHEGYTDKAVIPVPGDVPTIGFGTTEGVKMGDSITPPKALVRALMDVQKFEGPVKACITVPLTQYEYDAAMSLAYNIGPTAFCKSTVVKRFNAGQYAAACDAFTMWNKVKGTVVRGLEVRRQEERAKCLGEAP